MDQDTELYTAIEHTAQLAEDACSLSWEYVREWSHACLTLIQEGHHGWIVKRFEKQGTRLSWVPLHLIGPHTLCNAGLDRDWPACGRPPRLPGRNQLMSCLAGHVTQNAALQSVLVVGMHRVGREALTFCLSFLGTRSRPPLCCCLCLCAGGSGVSTYCLSLCHLCMLSHLTCRGSA